MAAAIRDRSRASGSTSRRRERFARLVEPSKLILMVGAYGYDWNDAEAVVRHQAEAYDFQEAMRAARGPSRPHSAMDPVSLNPYMQWTDRGLHRSRALVSRRDDGVQPDEGRPRARRGRPRDLAPRRRGSVDVERDRQRTDRCSAPTACAPFRRATTRSSRDTGEILQIQYFPAEGYRNRHRRSAHGLHHRVVARPGSDSVRRRAHGRTGRATSTASRSPSTMVRTDAGRR